MAAVNFYRFATAIMELLEPKPLNQELGSKANNVSNGSKNDSDSMVFIESAKIVALEAETAATCVPQSKETEAKTVETVAANLAQVLSNASSEKLTQVAEAIKQVAIETAPAISTQPTLLSQTIEQSKTINSCTEASQIVQATVSALAKQTVEEINVLKAEPVQDTKTVEAVTIVLTDKIQQKTADTIASVSIQDNRNNDSVGREPEDFWLSYKEIDPAQIQYSNAVSYLYDYMTDHSLLNFLDPAIEYDKRQTLMDEVIGRAQKKSVWESNLENVIRFDSTAQLEKLKDNELESDLANERKQTELLQKQRLESYKLTERIAAERMKESI